LFENTRFQKHRVFERHERSEWNELVEQSERNEVSIKSQKITENPQDFQSLKMLEAFLNYL